jgi:predicted dehydrogenase
MNSSPSTRRRFLSQAALFTGALSARSYAQVSGANEDIRVAVIGTGGRGKSHMDAFADMKGVRLVALCDVDQKILERDVKKYSEKTKSEIKGYTDVRKLLEAKDIDAISIATPNHWHALGTIWGVETGRDVYVEKPVSHNVWEGRQAVNAARKYKKIVQTGTQSRSSRKGIGATIEWVNQGNLGKITMARGLCYKPRKSIGKSNAPVNPPAEVDYDLWCGPAEKNALKRSKLHYDWHWVWNTGNGDLGNQGIHQMDICRWFLGENQLAPKVLSIGGRLGYEDDGETANTQIILQAYEKAPLLFEVRGLETKKFQNAAVGCIIHCEGGHILVPSYNDAIAYDKEGKEIQKWSGSGNHFGNFIEAVRSRKSTDLHADILEGHLSSALCHTGNISHRLGKAHTPEELTAAVKADATMTESLGRMVEHLQENKVNLNEHRLTLGAALTMDPKTERFIGNDAANQQLTREYRAPYVVKEIAS